MKKVTVLDCTLRDGGYCNQWNFGKKNISKIINGLVSADVDIIECGFLTNKIKYNESKSKFTKLNQVQEVLPNVDTRQLFVVMINYGEYLIEDLPECKDSPIDGIRVAFHKRDCRKAVEYCKKIKDKGYLVFMQPMVSMSYSDREFTELILEANEIHPYAFYIVDSFGMMKRRSLLHYFMITEALLDINIAIGFHSHNNFQSALSNAECLLEQDKKHNIIIDSSVYGMGRGAGNLNTELFLNVLNTEIHAEYLIKPLLQIMDEVLNRFYEENPWGYSLPNYLSASHMIHPNYANYLCAKNTLTVDAMDDIFSLMDVEKAVEFEPDYIEKIYTDYMSRGQVNNTRLEEFRQQIKGRKILLIAPGRTATDEQDRIRRFTEVENPIVVSINHEYPNCQTDFIFVSNMRRFRELPEMFYKKTIVTTNIKAENAYMVMDYYSLINSSEKVRDNAGMMAIQLMLNLGCRDIWLAGYDGYNFLSSDNYETSDMALIMTESQILNLNNGMKQVLKDYMNRANINFLTQSTFNNIEK